MTAAERLREEDDLRRWLVRRLRHLTGFGHDTGGGRRCRPWTPEEDNPRQQTALRAWEDGE